MKVVVVLVMLVVFALACGIDGVKYVSNAGVTCVVGDGIGVRVFVGSGGCGVCYIGCCVVGVVATGVRVLGSYGCAGYDFAVMIASCVGVCVYVVGVAGGVDIAGDATFCVWLVLLMVSLLMVLLACM